MNPTRTINQSTDDDHFRMFVFKIKICNRNHPHDWMECPFAHTSERARRRDPRVFPYSPIACIAYKEGNCPNGDSCKYSHGIFEYWLHPLRYRTRLCNAGESCQRRVCFFAHSAQQLRQPGPINQSVHAPPRCAWTQLQLLYCYEEVRNVLDCIRRLEQFRPDGPDISWVGDLIQ